MTSATPRVRDLSESELLAQIFPQLPRGGATIVGPGDDCAVVRAPDGRVVISTDVLVEGRHFRREWSSGYDVGWRAAMANLADVAAMGAVPTSIVVALVVPGELEASWVVDLARGLGTACAPYDVGVVGGDLSGGDAVVVSVTVHGDLEGRDPVLRSGARPGDVVGHAGVRGCSAAGLALLSAGAASAVSREQAAGAGAGADAAELSDLVSAFLRPDPPVRAGRAAALAGATSMLDVSDGLLLDAGRLAAASEVTLDLHLDLLADAVVRLEQAARLTGGDAVAWVLGGGEDHGMLATFPPGTALPEPFVRVGTVRAGAHGAVVDGEPWQGVTGWDHFARR